MKPRALKEKIGNVRRKIENHKQANHRAISKMEDLHNSSDPENWTSKQQQAFEAANSEAAAERKKVTALRGELDQLIDKSVEMNMNIDFENQPIPGTGNSNPSGIETWKNVSDENAPDVKVVGPRASLAEARQTNASDSDMADYLRDRVRGFTKSNSFQNAMDTSVDAALVPEPLSTQLIDKARAQSRVMQAGARTVDMTSKTLTIAKVKQDSSVDWVEENASHSSSDVNVEPLTFTAKKLVGSVKASVELAEDSSNLANLVQNNLAQQIGLKLDYAALMADGSGAAPTGIANTAGVQSIDLGSGNGGPISNYSEFSKGVQAINEENGAPNALIYSPRTWGTVDRLTATDDQPLQAPESYQNLNKFQTSQIPNDLTLGTASDASLAIIGDFSQVMVGVRTNIRLEVTRAASDSDNSSWEDLQIWFRAYARYDVQLAHPEHFYVINGIVPAS